MNSGKDTDWQESPESEDLGIDEHYHGADADSENPEPANSEAGRVTIRPFRGLTSNQQAFIRGVISGLSQRQAYREAYPNDSSNDAVISNSASRLMKNPHVSAAIRAGWSDSIEAMADDVIAQKRYVLKELLALSKSAKQEGSRLKALELMARSAGMFKDQVIQEAPAPTASQLKAELSSHLRLLGKKQH